MKPSESVVLKSRRSSSYQSHIDRPRPQRQQCAQHLIFGTGSLVPGENVRRHAPLRRRGGRRSPSHSEPPFFYHTTGPRKSKEPRGRPQWDMDVKMTWMRNGLQHEVLELGDFFRTPLRISHHRSGSKLEYGRSSIRRMRREWSLVECFLDSNHIEGSMQVRVSTSGQQAKPAAKKR